MDQYPGVPGTEFQAGSPDRESGQGLPASRGRLPRLGLRRNPPVRPWVPGMRGLLPEPSLPAFQGADLLRLLLHDRGCGGVRRTEQHDRRAGQCLCNVQAQDDCRLHHLHGRGDRRRPERLHQERQGKRIDSAGIRCPLRPYPGFRGLAHHGLRQHAQGDHGAFLGRKEALGE